MPSASESPRAAVLAVTLLLLVVALGCGPVVEPGPARGERTATGTILSPLPDENALYRMALVAGEAPFPQAGFYSAHAWTGNELRAWSRPDVTVPVHVPCRAALRIEGELDFAFQLPARLMVIWNGVPILTRAAAPGPVTLALDVAESRVDPGRNELRIVFPDAVVPSRIDSKSADGRLLGGAFARLEVRFRVDPREGRSGVVSPQHPVAFRHLVARGDWLAIDPEPGDLDGLRASGVWLTIREPETGRADARQLDVGAAPWRIDLSPWSGSPVVLELRLGGEACASSPVLRVRSARVEGASAPALADAEAVKLLVVGVDGATFDVLDPLMAAGSLPTLKELCDRGVRAPLRTIPFDRSPVVWATIATGRSPADHGILDFMYEDEDGAGLRRYTSSHFREPTFWEILGSHGISTGIVGWWNTWPARPLRGFMVSDLLWPYPMGRPAMNFAEAPGFLTYPEALTARLRPLVMDRDAAAEQVALLGCAAGDWHYLAEDLTVLRFTRELLDTSPTALLAVYVKDVDAYQHRYWRFMDPDAPAYPAGSRPTVEETKRFGRVIPRCYGILDRELRLLLDALPPDVNVIVLSDHGFGPGIDPSIKDWNVSGSHRPIGIFIAAGPAFAAGKRLGEKTVYDVAPTILRLFDVPVAADFEGLAMEDAFDPPLVSGRTVPSYHDLATERQRPAQAPYEPELLERLYQLGYLPR